MEAVTRRKEDNVWDGMPRAHFDALKEYLAYLRDEMKLVDWTFRLAHSPADDDAWAEVSIIWGRRFATISVCKDFVTLDRHDQRHSLVHELVHCYTDGVRAAIRTSIQEQFGALTWGLLSTAFQREVELATDGLADVIAPHLKLPVWPSC